MSDERTVYVFLRQRPIDSQPWPLVYPSRELAMKADHRASAVVEVHLPLEGEFAQIVCDVMAPPREMGAAGKCPSCGHLEFFEGPHGGMSVNVKCANPTCGRKFNWMGPFGMQPIDNADAVYSERIISLPERPPP